MTTDDDDADDLTAWRNQRSGIADDDAVSKPGGPKSYNASVGIRHGDRTELTSEQWDMALVRLYNAGLTLRAIAAQMGCTHTGVRKALIRIAARGPGTGRDRRLS